MGKSKPKDVIFLRRLIAIFLCLCFIAPVYAHGEKYVALTFDDGPSGRFTRNLLDGLAQRDVKATFLLCGYRLRDYPKEGCRIWAEGHEIGLHGYSHDPMDQMSEAELIKELQMTSRLLPEGCKPVFLRPPGGAYSPMVRRTAASLGLGILNWSVDPKDWACHDANTICQTVVCTVRDGDVILLHDMSDSSVEASLAIVDELKAQGFQFVTATELARLKGTPIEPGKVYERFG
jgi:peptidoglycan/xylan/chitin deacetylase (PgdA/CDA1 family)